MGFSFSKDKNIDIYMILNKQVYISGEVVQGEVYLNVKNYRLYRRLNIILQGEQYVSWDEGTGQDKRSVDKKIKNYESSVILKDFQGQIQQGQYVFPFSMLLPSMITGSFYNSAFCYLKYTLRAELEHPSNPNQSQYYEMFLNILQPPRVPLGPTSITNRVDSKCCNCCMDYGVTSITLNSDRNFLHNGDSVRVGVIVDNSRGKQTVERCTLALEQWRFMAVSQNQTQNIRINQYVLGSLNNQIYKGSSRNFELNCKIPEHITNYTAIGNIIARYFILHLTTEYGCCANKPEAKLHVIMHSTTPQIVEKKPVSAPANWNPRVYQKVNFNNMKPFIYSPLKCIPFLNSGSNQQIMNENNYNPPQLGYNGSQSSNMLWNSNYHPVYYNHQIFSQVEQQQQGYQPYF